MANYPSLLFLKYPHIVHDHSLWELCISIWRARPIAPNGNVENKKEGTVEGIIRRVWVREKLLVIDKHLHAVRSPGHAEDVKLIIK